MSGSYSEQFCERQQAEQYDRLYAPGTADDILWRIEQGYLRHIVQALRKGCPRIEHLDFACGTGRVIAFLEAMTDQSVGVDISLEMTRIAAGKVKRSQIRCADITAEPVGQVKYDLITAFRFFLNAEPGLRARIMSLLASRLRDKGSRLVFTSHGNPISYKAILWPFHRLRQAVRGRRLAGNYLMHGEVVRLAQTAGLEVVDRIGMGFITPKLVRFAPSSAARIEGALAGCRILGQFGVNQLYVVRRMSFPGT